MQNKLMEENNSLKSKLIQHTKTEKDKEKDNENDIIDDSLLVYSIDYDLN